MIGIYLITFSRFYKNGKLGLQTKPYAEQHLSFASSLNCRSMFLAFRIVATVGFPSFCSALTCKWISLAISFLCSPCVILLDFRFCFFSTGSKAWFGHGPSFCCHWMEDSAFLFLLGLLFLFFLVVELEDWLSCELLSCHCLSFYGYSSLVGSWTCWKNL